jgi:proliferating cell nuclear antigen
MQILKRTLTNKNKMFLKTVQATAIKSLLEVLKDIINDVNIYFDSTGMKIIAFDVARVTLVYVKLAAENFEEYSCPTELVLGINVTNTFKLLKSISNTDILSITNNDENLIITVSNDGKKSTSKFSIRLLDLNEDILEIPETDASTSHETLIPSIDFQKIVRDMSNIGSELLIKRTSNTVEFSCEGDFAEKQTIIEQADDVGPKGATGVFSLKYLSMFTKATILCPIVQIVQESDDSPIVFKYTIANLGDLRFYLAPISV